MSEPAWTCGVEALQSPTGRCVACGRDVPPGVGPRTQGTRDWLARGLVLEAHVAAEPPTAMALRDLMAAVVRRSLVDQNLKAAVLLRMAAAWASEATLLDLAHWALGPGLWTGPATRRSERG